MATKTINVKKMVEFANARLTKDNSREERNGIILMVEEILHSTENYKGYFYLNKNDLPNNVLPGINVDDDGYALTDYELRSMNTDDTRRHYFY
jgi:hypothetical protein